MDLPALQTILTQEWIACWPTAIVAAFIHSGWSACWPKARAACPAGEPTDNGTTRGQGKNITPAAGVGPGRGPCPYP